MLSSYFIQLHARFSRSRKAKRNLFFLLIGLVLLAIIQHLAFLLRRLYYRSYDVDSWFVETEACEGNFIGYGHQFVRLRNAELDVVNKAFKVPCSSGIPKYWFYKGYQGTPLEQWLAEMRPVEQSPITNFRSGITLVVHRNEAHNPYHTFCEYYNIFLLVQHFHWDTKDVKLLFMDSRPDSPLDEMWKTLFGDFRRLSDLSSNEGFTELVWMPIGYESPMNFHSLQSIPYTEEFRSFVLKSFGVVPGEKNCKKLKIVLILRHDYISHPERMELFGGKVHRKIANEPEVIWALENAFPTHTVKTAVLENMSMKEQLELMSSTDVLIGMHGAGLAHIMFLPTSACVLELFPYSYRRRRALYFIAMGRWRHLKHFVWTNPSKEDEVDPGFNSRVPPEYITKVSGQIKGHIKKNYCPYLVD